MPSFTQYLQANKIEKSELKNKQYRNFHYGVWSNSLKEYLKATKELLPKATFGPISEGFSKAELEIYSTGANIEFFIQRADNNYRILKNYIDQQIIRKNTVKPLLIPCGYPFADTVSGVAFQSNFLVEPLRIDNKLLFTESSVTGMSSDKAKEAIEEVRRNIGSINWLNDGLKELGVEISDITHKSDPHAEEVWFVRHANELIDYLEMNKKFYISSLPELDDELWHIQLFRFPRLQFISSSSCCSECQYLFRSLRLKLNKMGINIPIVIFSDSPFNREQDGAVYIIKRDGTFFNTQLQCDSPKVRASLARSIVSHPRLTKDEIDDVKLRVFGNLLFPSFSSSPLRFAHFFSPDSVAVSRQDWEPPTPTPLTQKEVARLNNFSSSFQEINPLLLLRWRMKLLKEYYRALGVPLSQSDDSPTIDYRIEITEDSYLEEVKIFYNNAKLLLYKLPPTDQFTGLEEEVHEGRAHVQVCAIS